MFKRIRPSALSSVKPTYIIDVREPEEFILGNIPNSINIPVDVLLDNYEQYLDQDKCYYIYCETDLRSTRICEFLDDLGYNVCLIEGGYKAWLDENKLN